MIKTDHILLRHFHPFCIFLCFITLIGCTGPEKQLDELRPDATILAFGDSLTVGVGAKTGEDYPSLLSTLTNLEVFNAGVSGERTGQGLKRLPGVLSQVMPRLVILIHGGNDFLRKESAKRTEENLLAMIDLIQQRGAQVILVAVPKPGLFISDHPVYEQVANTANILLIDDVLSDILSDNNLKSDTIHPNAKGYSLLADSIYQALLHYGALPISSIK